MPTESNWYVESRNKFREESYREKDTLKYLPWWAQPQWYFEQYFFGESVARTLIHIAATLAIIIGGISALYAFYVPPDDRARVAIWLVSAAVAFGFWWWKAVDAYGKAWWANEEEHERAWFRRYMPDQGRPNRGLHGDARNAAQQETAEALSSGKRTSLDALTFDDLGAPPAPGVPSPLPLGRFYDARTGQPGARNLYAREQHVLLFGLNGAGKLTRILAEMLLTAENQSMVVLDIKGELAAVSAKWRRTIGDVKIINPMGLHVDLPGYDDLRSDGFEPLSAINLSDPRYYENAMRMAAALVAVEGDPQRYFPESARDLLVALILWEKFIHGDQASLANVRYMLTEPDEWEIDPETGKEILIRGLSATARVMVEMNGAPSQIAELAGRFVAENTNDEIRSIQSTARTHTRWISSNAMAEDMRKAGVDFSQLKKRPTTVYIILPVEDLDIHGPWLKMVVTAALVQQFKPGGMPVLFILDEFYAALGSLEIIKNLWSTVRGYGIRIMPILQSVGQLKELFKENWEIYAGQAGAVVTVGPAGDLVTAEWMSKRSGMKTATQVSQHEGSSSGTSEGTQYGQHGSTSSGSNSGTNTSKNAQPVKVPHLLPQDLMNIPVGMGRMWTPGYGDVSHEIFAPNYWKVIGLREGERARRNPYAPPDAGETSPGTTLLLPPPERAPAGETV